MYKSYLKKINNRIVPSQSIPIISIDSEALVLRGERFLWKDISDITIAYTGSYRRSYTHNLPPFYCQCAYFKINNTTKRLDLGCNFNEKDREKILVLLKSNYPKFNIK